jgi:general secretion pathway protein D
MFKLIILFNFIWWSGACFSKSSDAKIHFFSFEQPTDIKEIIKSYTKIVNKNIVFSNSIKGKISLLSPNKLTLVEVKEIFLSLLSFLGYNYVSYSSYGKIVKLSKKNFYFNKDESANLATENYAKIFEFKNISAKQAMEIIAKLIDPRQVVSLGKYDSVLIFANNAVMARLAEIIEHIDSKESKLKVKIYYPKYAPAIDLYKKIQQLEVLKKNVFKNTKLILMEEQNILVVVGGEGFYAKIKLLLEGLDKKSVELVNKNFYVIPLDFTKADKVLSLLKGLPKSFLATDVRADREYNVFSDRDNNSILLLSDYASYQKILWFIKKIDKRPPQILLDISILELGNNFKYTFKSAFFGAGFSVADKVNVVSGWEGGEVAPIVVSQFNSTDLNNSSQELLKSFSESATVGVFLPGKIHLNGFENISPVQLMNLFKSDGTSHEISNPKLLTINAQKVSFMFGEKILFPIVENSPEGISESKIEKEDVSIEISCTPKIKKENEIDLDISINITSILGISAGGYPYLGKKKIVDKVNLKNLQTAFISGLFSTREYESKKNIPFFSKIPLIGPLFTRFETIIQKNHMIIFITPKIIYGKSDLSKLINQNLKSLYRIKKDFDIHGKK